MTIDGLLEIAGFCIGLLYLWWEYHADRRVWIASVVMPAVSMWIYLSKGIYADFAINIYYLLIALYGWLRWSGLRMGRQPDKPKKQLPVSHTPTGAWPGIAAAAGALWLGLWLILSRLTDSTIPVADAFTTALSVVALWMMARKWAEQWLLWLVVDAACVGIYYYKGLMLYSLLYAAYTVIAVAGYRKWLRIMSEERKGSGATS